MLTSEEEASLRESLRFSEEDRWLHLLYRSVSFWARRWHRGFVYLITVLSHPHSSPVDVISNPTQTDIERPGGCCCVCEMTGR